MAVNAFTSNQGTQTSILTDNTGGTAGTVIPVMKISFDGQGTYTDANLFQGTIKAINTIGTLPNLLGGTLGSVLGIGSVSGLSNLPGGTLNLITTISNLTNGSINVTTGTIGGKTASGAALSGNPIPMGGTDGGGTVYGFLTDTKGQQYLGGGTVSMLNAGTVTQLTNGTVQIGTIGTLGLGTITGNLGTMGTVGTLSNIGSVTNLGQVYNAGTLQAGTITTGSINIPNGTIQALGTLGTLGLGTVRQDARTTQNILSYGTQFSGTAAAVGTLVGSASVGAGTSLWVNDLSLMNPYGSVLCVVGFGTVQQGTNVLFRGILGTQTAVGIEKSYAKAVNAGMTNQDLVFSLGGAGTVDISLSYFISS